MADEIGLGVGLAAPAPLRSRMTPPAPPLVEALDVLVYCALATPAAGAAAYPTIIAQSASWAL